MFENTGYNKSVELINILVKIGSIYILYIYYLFIHTPTWTALRGNSFGYCIVRIYSYVVWPLKPRASLFR